MKKYLLILAAAFLLAGCANRYDIITNSGAKLSGVSKPILHTDTDEYFFTDATGKHLAIRTGKVRVIQVHEEGKQFINQSDSGFRASPSR